MALDRTIDIIFSGVDEVSGTIDSISSEISGMAGNVQDATAPFVAISEAAIKAEIAVIAIGTALAGLSINQAGAFSDQFREISTLTGQASTDLNIFREDILDYSRDSTQSLETINGALYSAISAGIDYSDSVDFMSTSEQLAVAGKADLNSATVLLASTLNAYGASTEEATRYSDAFFQTVKDGQTTLPELAHSMAQVTGIAASAGIDIETLTASISALTAAGLPTSQAMTGLKAAISNIIKPTSEARDMAKSLGIEFNASALESLGFDGVLKQVYDSTGGNVEQIGKLFGSIEGLNVALVLGSDTAGKFAQNLQNQADKAGVVAAAYAEMEQQFSVVNAKLVNNMQTTLIQLGLPMLDSYGNAVGGLEDIFRSLGTSIDAGVFDPLLDAMNGALDDFGDFASEIAEVLPEALSNVDFSGLVDSFEGLAEEVFGAFNDFFDGADLTSAEGLEDFIQGLVDALENLTHFTAGVVQGFGPMLDGLKLAFDYFTNLEAGSATAAGEIAGFGTAINKIAGIIDGANIALNAFSAFFLSGAVRNVVSLASALGLTGSAVSGFGAATLAATGLLAPYIIAVGAAGGAVAATVNAYGDMIDAQLEATKAQLNAELSAEKLAEKYEDISSTTGVLVTNTQDLKEALADGTLKISNFTGELVSADQYAAEFDDHVQSVAKSSWDWADASKNMIPQLQSMGFALDDTGEAIKPVVDEFELLAAAVRKDMGVESIKGTFSVVSSSAGEVTDSLDKAAESTDEFRMKMEELASDERISSMELAVDIKVAQIEADAERAVAAIEGLGTTVESSSQLIADLAGSLTELNVSANGYSEKWLIEDMMEDANTRANDAAEKQLDLIDAQIDNLETKTAAIKDGGSLITISADGLEPALQEVLYSLVEQIQIRAVEEGGSLLLGV